jgi:hypothetical protein
LVAEAVLRQHLNRAPGLKDQGVAGLAGEVDLSIGRDRRGAVEAAETSMSAL